MVMIEISEDKLSNLSENIEKGLRYMGKAMQCVDDLMQGESYGNRIDENERWRMDEEPRRREMDEDYGNRYGNGRYGDGYGDRRGVPGSGRRRY